MRTIILKNSEIDRPTVAYPTGHAILLAGSSEARNGVSSGTYRIATYLRKKGWQIKVFDFILNLSKEDIYQLVQESLQPDTKWLGVSYNWLSDNITAHEIIKELKKRHPELKLILGGQMSYYVDLEADYYVLGYGEYALDAILEHEFSTGPVPKHEKLFNGKLINAYHDYRATPLDTYKVEYDQTDHITNQHYMSIELARGCKFSCSFCSFPFIGMKQDTSVEEEELYRELSENYQKFGSKAYMIADDTFNDQSSKIIKLKNVVNRLDFKPDFWAFIRIDLLRANPEQYELLAESRVWTHVYGIETFNKKTGLAIGKGLNPEIRKSLMLEMKNYMTKHLGLYRGSASFIAGLPHESIESMLETEKWLKENWADQSRLWWPLIILNEQKILSALGKDMTKFGYTEILPTDSDYGTLKRLISPIKGIPWRNEYTNVFEINDLVLEFHKEAELLDSFKVLQYLPVYNFDYAKVLTMKYFFPFDTLDYKKRCIKIAREYFEKIQTQR